MIIEFYGLEGVGKTTLAKKIEENTDFKIIKINNKLELIFYNFLFLIKYPLKFFILFFYLIVNYNFFYLKFMNSFLHHNAKYEKALKTKNALIDQGHFQNIISVFDNKKSFKHIFNYSKFFPYPDKLVIFKLDEQERKARIKKRFYSSRKGNKEKIDKWRKISKENNSIFLKNINKLSLSYLIIDNFDLDKSYLLFIKAINEKK